MGVHVKVLKCPAVGPDGDRFRAGQQVPAHWPDWFVADLDAAGHLDDPPTKKAAAGPRMRKATA